MARPPETKTEQTSDRGGGTTTSDADTEETRTRIEKENLLLDDDDGNAHTRAQEAHHPVVLPKPIGQRNARLLLTTPADRAAHAHHNQSVKDGLTANHLPILRLRLPLRPLAGPGALWYRRKTRSARKAAIPRPSPSTKTANPSKSKSQTSTPPAS